DRLIDARGAPLVTRDHPTAPLAALPVRALDPCPRQRDRRRAQTRCQRALALPVPVTSANRTDPLRPGCAQRRLQFLVDDGLDGRPNPLPHQLLEAPFSSLQTPAIAFHSVILRHPPPSGCELGTTRRIMTLFYFSTNCTTLPKAGTQDLSLQIGAYDLILRPDDAPRWIMRVSATF